MDFIKNNKLKTIFTKHTWLIPVFAAFVIRVVDITRSSIWHDEGFTMWIIRNNPIDIIARTALDVHPPAYYLAAKIWTFAFGDSVFAIRSLSLVFSLATIFLVYKIIENIWNKKAAFWASMLVTFSPFLLRLTQEARMYSMVAFFIALAVYFFVKYLKEKKSKYLLFFIPAMAVAMYTQYYSFFAIISLWVIMAILTPNIFKHKWKELIKKSAGLFDYKWWLANIALLVLYLPWFFTAFSQLTRVGGGYWIRPEWMTARTVPNTVLQFVTYGHLDPLYHSNGFFGPTLYWVIALAFVLSGLLLLVFKEKRKIALSLLTFGYLPMIMVFAYSKIRTPIYQDRYFIFASLAIFAIWGCLIASIKNKTAKAIVVVLIFSVLTIGCLIERNSEYHKMHQLTQTIGRLKEKNDIIISGSLYTFLDSSYYLGYGNVKYLSSGVGGHGETSLFYDKPEAYTIKPTEISKSIDRIWIIGKSGENYIEKISSTEWKQSIDIKEGSLEAFLYVRQ